MIAARGALAVLATLPLSTAAANADPPVEQAIQYALERIQSGVPLIATTADGRRIEVRVQRTWKSVTGHYCRQYDARAVDVAQAFPIERGTRCREQATWKKVENQ